jgi:hypothetical protein
MKPQIGGLYKKINYDEYALVLDVDKLKGKYKVTYVIYSRDTRFNGEKYNTSIAGFRYLYAPYAPAV